MQRIVRRSQTLRSRRAPAGLLALALLSTGLAVVAGTVVPRSARADVPTTDMRTRDIGGVPVTCNNEVFITSLNTDDDNRNDRADRREELPLENGGRENNLRAFVFDVPEATRVFVAEVARIPSNEIVVGSQVRAYEEDKATKFAFGDREVPVTMYLEGKQQSASPNDIGFEYQYFKDDGSTVCGGFVQGTVVRADASLAVATGAGTPFAEHHKMLITGNASADATVAPASLAAPQWSYDAPGAIFSTPTELATKFRAPETFTPEAQIGQHRVRLTLTATATNPAAQVIEANVPVNLTGPRSLEIREKDEVCKDNTASRQERTGQLDTVVVRDHDPVYFTLFNWSKDTEACIAYNLLDQTGKRITLSAYAGRRPDAKENIGRVLVSRIDAMQRWIKTELRHSPNWRDMSDGILRDGLRAVRLPKHLIVNDGRFHRVLRSEGGVLMQVAPPNTHIWSLSVRGRLVNNKRIHYGVVEATNNTFSSVVDDVEGQGGRQKIIILSRYRVVLP